MLKRKYKAVRLLGRDRPYRAPGRLIHAQEINGDGKPFYTEMAVCGRQPRPDSEGFEIFRDGEASVTCERCVERMR